MPQANSFGGNFSRIPSWTLRGNKKSICHAFTTCMRGGNKITADIRAAIRKRHPDPSTFWCPSLDPLSMLSIFLSAEMRSPNFSAAIGLSGCDGFSAPCSCILSHYAFLTLQVFQSMDKLIAPLQLGTAGSFLSGVDFRFTWIVSRPTSVASKYCFFFRTRFL